MRSLRFDGETDEEFRRRAERVAVYGKMLVDGALINKDIQSYIADPSLPYSVEEERRSPTVRVEFEEAVAIGRIGECLAATKSKHWGAGPWIAPLEPDDPVDPMRIVYIYRENSRYNRRFEQRQRLKELLGREFRPLVGEAKSHTKKVFLSQLTERQAWAIRRLLSVEPGEFWRACKGSTSLDLPEREEQSYFDFMADG